jgi:sulfide dehydrogenase cytochrome subunit
MPLKRVRGPTRSGRRARLLLSVALFASPLAVMAEPPGAASCLGCHPPAVAHGPVPTLAGRKAADIVNAMQAFRAGTLKGTVMERIAKGFSDEEIRAIADWYARAGNKKPRS